MTKSSGWGLGPRRAVCCGYSSVAAMEIAANRATDAKAAAYVEAVKSDTNSFQTTQIQVRPISFM